LAFFVFGASNEKLSPTQTELFDEADGDAAEIEADNVASISAIEIPAHTRGTKKRVSIPADIPRLRHNFSVSIEGHIIWLFSAGPSGVISSANLYGLIEPRKQVTWSPSLKVGAALTFCFLAHIYYVFSMVNVAQDFQQLLTF
jgi:hypothetical protein